MKKGFLKKSLTGIIVAISFTVSSFTVPAYAAENNQPAKYIVDENTVGSTNKYIDGKPGGASMNSSDVILNDTLRMRTSKKISKSGKYKSDLNKNELAIYKAMESKNWKTAKSAVIYLPVDRNNYTELDKYYKEVLRGYWSYIRDHAEVYWINAFSFNYWWDGSGDIYMMELTPIKYYDTILREDKAVRKALNSAVTQIKKKRKNRSKYETLKQIHNYCVKKITYGHEYTVIPREHTITGGLLKKYNNVGVCESYAKTFKILCDRFNITCMLVQGENHIYDFVKLDGRWYLVDPTWDDPYNVLTYEYFLVGRTKALADHNPTNEYKMNSGTLANLAVPKLYIRNYKKK